MEINNIVGGIVWMVDMVVVNMYFVINCVFDVVYLVVEQVLVGVY